MVSRRIVASTKIYDGLWKQVIRQLSIHSPLPSVVVDMRYYFDPVSDRPGVHLTMRHQYDHVYIILCHFDFRRQKLFVN